MPPGPFVAASLRGPLLNRVSAQGIPSDIVPVNVTIIVNSASIANSHVGLVAARNDASRRGFETRCYLMMLDGLLRFQSANEDLSRVWLCGLHSDPGGCDGLDVS